MLVYDRGGYATATLKVLAHEGVKQLGIQPKGQRVWHVAEDVRQTIRSERGKTEGIIGTLKTDKYGFNKPKERLWQTLEMAGPRSILSFNLNKLMRESRPAAGMERGIGAGNRETAPERDRERKAKRPFCARIPWVPLDNMPLGCNGHALLFARLAAIEDIKRLGRQPL